MATAAAAALLVARVPIGVATEWPLSYIATRNSPAVLVEPFVPAVLLVAAAAFGLSRPDRAARRRLALAGLVVGGFLFSLYLAMAGPAGVGEPAYRALFTAGIGSYLDEAERVGPFPNGATPAEAAAPGPIAYLRGFHRRVAEHPLDHTAFRVAVHPPGMTLVAYGLDRVWRGAPAGPVPGGNETGRPLAAEGGGDSARPGTRAAASRRREAAAALLRRLGWPTIDLFLRPERPTLSRPLTGLSLFVLGSLVVALTALAVYALAHDLSGSRGAALGAAALWLTVPSTLLHAPALDQLTPLMAVLIALFWFRACARRSRRYAVLAGLAAWMGLFFTLAMAVVVFCCALATVLAVPRAEVRRHWSLAAWTLGAAALVSLVTWAALDYNVVLVLYQCARRNAEWNATIGARSYGAWLVWNPAMFALFLGPAATTLWLWGTASAVGGWRRGVRILRCGRVARVACNPCLAASRTGWQATGATPLSLRTMLDARSPTPDVPPGLTVNIGRAISRTSLERAARAAAIAVAVTLLLLWLSGQNRGEVERLWSFLMALALVAGAGALAHARPLTRGAWLALMVLQLVLVFVLRYRVDVQNVLANLAEYMRGLGLPPGP